MHLHHQASGRLHLVSVPQFMFQLSLAQVFLFFPLQIEHWRKLLKVGLCDEDEKKKSVIYKENNYSSSSVIMAPSVESPPEAFTQTPSCSKD